MGELKSSRFPQILCKDPVHRLYVLRHHSNLSIHQQTSCIVIFLPQLCLLCLSGAKIVI